MHLKLHRSDIMSVKNCPGIDAPIVPVLDQLNALGFETSWSCCGYDYPRQENKTHDKAHVRVECSQASIDALLDVLERGWWQIEYLGNNMWAFWALYKLPVRPSTVKQRWKILKQALDKLEVIVKYKGIMNINDELEGMIGKLFDRCAARTHKCTEDKCRYCEGVELPGEVFEWRKKPKWRR